MDYLKGKVAVVIGSGGDAHRGVAVALAQAGADVAIAGPAATQPEEAALHSIANEIWALGRRSAVVTLGPEEGPSFPVSIDKAQRELGRADLVVACEPVLNA